MSIFWLAVIAAIIASSAWTTRALVVLASKSQLTVEALIVTGVVSVAMFILVGAFAWMFFYFLFSELVFLQILAAIWLGLGISTSANLSEKNKGS